MLVPLVHRARIDVRDTEKDCCLHHFNVEDGHGTAIFCAVKPAETSQMLSFVKYGIASIWYRYLRKAEKNTRYCIALLFAGIAHH